MADKNQKSDKNFEDQPTQDNETDIGGQAGGQSSDTNQKDDMGMEIEDDDLGTF